MHTLHDIYAARLVAADQARRNRELREQIERDEAIKRSDAGDFVIGLVSGLGLSVMLWLIVWSWVAS